MVKSYSSVNHTTKQKQFIIIITITVVANTVTITFIIITIIIIIIVAVKIWKRDRIIVKIRVFSKIRNISTVFTI